MSDSKAPQQQPLATRAFLYIRKGGHEADELHRLKQRLTKFTEDLGVQVLDTFVDEQEIPGTTTASAFDRLLDALWRNDGVLLVTDAPGQLASDVHLRQSRQARIGETSALVLYVQHAFPH